MRGMGWSLVFVLGGTALAAPGLPGTPPPEHHAPVSKLELPAVPAFEVAAAPAGMHGVGELLVAGTPLLGTTVKVAGYVTWIYECAVAVRRGKESRAQTQKRIDRDPTLCERAKFYLADTKDTAREKSLWVVDPPRPYYKLEIERIPKADRTPEAYPGRCEPDPKRTGPLCFPLAVGEYVTIEGTFAVESPHAERNSDGLLVFGSIAPATPPATIAMRAIAPPAAKPIAAFVPKAAAPAAAPAYAVQQASVKHANAATRAYAQQDYALAETEYRAALAAWPGNHLAWYGLAGVFIGTSNWSDAGDAAAKAFELVPTDPMYAMVAGYTLYSRPSPDLARAEQVLRHAVKLDDQLWRAHYYLGRIARDSGRTKEAGEELTKALASAPTEAAPWIALVEIYRRWQRPDLALVVAEQGTLAVRASEAADVWYELGMANDELRRDAPAIEGFTKALEVAPTHAKALFQRGQVYFRTGKRAEARRDLEAFLASGSADASAVPQAQRMLEILGPKKPR